ncbi:MAG: hypothetical protein LBU22_00585, partial [Dysgonamonadaceae bacterium]|nr:hypothetical protein [Dysgonamonadaceae bacterium]
FRDITDAANYLPDDHRYKDYFTGIMTSNLKAMDKFSDDNPSPLGFIPRFVGNDGGFVTDGFPWQYAYLAWSLDHAIRQNTAADGSIMRNRILTVALASLNTPDFPREYATMYWPFVGTWIDAENIDYFTTWHEILEVNYRNDDGTLKPHGSWEGGYGNEMHVLMVLAKQAGLPNAAASLAWVDYEAGSGWMIGSLNERPAYALLDVPASGTSIEPPAIHSPSNGLKASTVPGGLLITGLVQGESFRTYNLQGQLIYQGKATATEERVPLRERGVYIVTAGNGTVKAVY